MKWNELVADLLLIIVLVMIVVSGVRSCQQEEMERRAGMYGTLDIITAPAININE